MEPVTQDMDSVERGRIPCHDVQFEVGRLHRAYGAARLQQQHTLLMSRAGAPPAAWLSQSEHCASRVAKQARTMREHYNSYDMVTRASKDYGQPRIEEPWVELRCVAFEAAVSWTKAEFLEMVASLELVPRTLRAADGCRATRELGVFIFLAYECCHGKFDHVCDQIRASLSWVKSIFYEVRAQLSQYRNVVRSIDVLRVGPLLQGWNEALTDQGVTPHTYFVIDGRAIRTSTPGTGQAASAVAASAGVPVSHVADSVYNGNYCSHGIKVQHAMQCDGMLMAFVDSIRPHDSPILGRSALADMIPLCDAYLPHGEHASAFTDSAYARSTCVRPSRTRTQLAAMAPAARQAAVDQDARDGRWRSMDEVSFNDVCKRYYHFENERYLRWFCGGGSRPRNNFPQLAAEYEIVVFMENLRACVYGATRGALLGVEPPTVQEYLANRHRVSAAHPNGLLVAHVP